jgi:hypothetical protein
MASAAGTNSGKPSATLFLALRTKAYSRKRPELVLKAKRGLLQPRDGQSVIHDALVIKQRIGFIHRTHWVRSLSKRYDPIHQRLDVSRSTQPEQLVPFEKGHE